MEFLTFLNIMDLVIINVLKIIIFKFIKLNFERLLDFKLKKVKKLFSRKLHDQFIKVLVYY